MSIIGNPIMSGGGGKNISSIIITGLKSTDTITCTKDGKSYPATWDETSLHWEIIGLPLGTFTITAANGTKTKTKTVLIDISGIYEVAMDFKLWIYNYGEEVDGGLVISTLSDHTGWIKNDNNISVTTSTASGKGGSSTVRTNRTFDLSTYNTLYFDTGFNMNYHVYNIYEFGIFDSSGNTALLRKLYEKQASVSRQVISIPITQVSGLDNCIIKAFFQSYQNSSATIYRIWAE